MVTAQPCSVAPRRLVGRANLTAPCSGLLSGLLTCLSSRWLLGWGLDLGNAALVNCEMITSLRLISSSLVAATSRR